MQADSSRILPTLRNEAQTVLLYLGLLPELDKRGISEGGLVQEYRALYKDVLRLFLEQTDLAILFPETTTKQNKEKACIIDSRNLIQLVSRSVRATGDDNELRQSVLKKLADLQYGTLAPPQLDQIWAPLLPELQQALLAVQVALTDTSCRGIFKSVIQAYIEKFVGDCPKVEKSFVRPTCPC